MITLVDATDAHIGLLDVEPDLAARLPAQDLDLARTILRFRAVAVRRGERVALDGEPGTLWLVVSGALMQTTVVSGRRNAVLLGAGDLVRWPPPDVPMAECVSMDSVQSGIVAALDRRLRAAAQRWPELGGYVEERLAVQAHRWALHAATCTLPRVHDRILAALEQIAASWGRVRPDGTYVALDISHRRLGEVIGAQRPTVTLALHDLASEDRLHRVDGGWLLRPPAVTGAVRAADAAVAV